MLGADAPSAIVEVVLDVPHKAGEGKGDAVHVEMLDGIEGRAVERKPKYAFKTLIKNKRKRKCALVLSRGIDLLHDSISCFHHALNCTAP